MMFDLNKKYVPFHRFTGEIVIFQLVKSTQVKIIFVHSLRTVQNVF